MDLSSPLALAAIVIAAAVVVPAVVLHLPRASIEPLKVTFDSNVWEDVVFPDRVLGRPERHQQALQVREAIECRKLIGFFAETWATLEGIEKCARADFFGSQSIEPRVIEIVQSDGRTAPGVIMGPNQSHRPPLSTLVLERLEAAAALGLRLLRVPRYHELALSPALFAEQTERIACRTGLVLEAMRDHKVGMAKIREFGLALAQSRGFSGVFGEIPPVELTPEERKTLARLVAEWADGDAIAAHFGYANDVFCTEDFGRAAKGGSVLDSDNRKWLSDAYGIRFVTLAELAKMVAT